MLTKLWACERMWFARAGDRNRTRIQASLSTSPLYHTVNNSVGQMLLVAGIKTTNHSSSGWGRKFLGSITAADRGKDGHGHVTARIASTMVGAPHSLFLFLFFSLSYSLSLWVPQGGGGWSGLQ